jgi:HSP20 family protein
MPARRVQRSTGLDASSEFAEIYDRMGQLVNLAFGSPGLTQVFDGPWTPPADISETDDSYVIEIDLPGVDKKRMTREVNDRDLVINGELIEKEGRRLLRRKERRTGRFEFRATLPGDIKADTVTADLSNGVLTVTVPKSDAGKPRRVDITSRGS